MLLAVRDPSVAVTEMPHAAKDLPEVVIDHSAVEIGLLSVETEVLPVVRDLLLVEIEAHHAATDPLSVATEVLHAVKDLPLATEVLHAATDLLLVATEALHAVATSHSVAVIETATAALPTHDTLSPREKTGTVLRMAS